MVLCIDVFVVHVGNTLRPQPSLESSFCSLLVFGFILYGLKAWLEDVKFQA